MTSIKDSSPSDRRASVVLAYLGVVIAAIGLVLFWLYGIRTPSWLAIFSLGCIVSGLWGISVCLA